MIFNYNVVVGITSVGSCTFNIVIVPEFLNMVIDLDMVLVIQESTMTMWFICYTLALQLLLSVVAVDHLEFW